MFIVVTHFIRNVLNASTFISGVTGILMMLGTSLLSPFLELPAELLFWAGLALALFVATLAVIARHAAVSKLVMIDLVDINVLWVIGSFALALSSVVVPNALGISFVSAQALARGLRRIAVHRCPLGHGCRRNCLTRGCRVPAASP